MKVFKRVGAFRNIPWMQWQWRYYKFNQSASFHGNTMSRLVPNAKDTSVHQLVAFLWSHFVVSQLFQTEVLGDSLDYSAEICIFQTQCSQAKWSLPVIGCR